MKKNYIFIERIAHSIMQYNHPTYYISTWLVIYPLEIVGSVLCSLGRVEF